MDAFWQEHIKWIFSGVGVAAITMLITLILRKRFKEKHQGVTAKFGKSKISAQRDVNITIGYGQEISTSTGQQTSISISQHVDSHEIIEVIKEQQQVYVRESYGEWAHECFTDDDLKKFKKNGIPEEITRKLRQNKKFIEIVNSLKKLSEAQRKKILNKATMTYKKTWAEIGMITKEGQTEAGQMAERLIAHAIVELAKEFMN